MMRYRTTHIQHTLLLSSKSNNNRLIAEKEQHKMSFYAKKLCPSSYIRILIHSYLILGIVYLAWLNFRLSASTGFHREDEKLRSLFLAVYTYLKCTFVIVEKTLRSLTSTDVNAFTVHFFPQPNLIKV